MAQGRMNKILPYIVAIVCALVAYLEYSHPEVVTKTETKVVDRVITITKIVKQPNGETDTTITTDETKNISVDSSTKTPLKKTINISALIGMNFEATIPRQVYGISLSKEIIGPVTLGVYALTNRTVGVTIGIDF